MFPSLCFIDISSGVIDKSGKEKLESNVDEESYKVISQSENNSSIKFKFKIIEFFAQYGLFTAKN